MWGGSPQGGTGLACEGGSRRAGNSFNLQVGRQGQRTVVGPGWGRGAVVAAWGSMSTETAWQGECAGKMRPVASRACDRGALIAIQANGNF